MSDEIQKKQIIDYTSTTTLANGDKLLLQKADGTTMNVDYTELARNIITQYNAQTLAGSAQSIQSAFSALNSNLAMGNGTINSILTRTDGSTDTKGTYVTCGGIAVVSFQLGGITLANGGVKIATLSKAKPISDSAAFGIGYMGTATINGAPVRCHINATGELYVYATEALTGTLRSTMTYRSNG